MLGVDECGDAAKALCLGHDVQGEGGLAGRLGAEDLDDAAPWHAADAQRQVKGEGAGGDGVLLHPCRDFAQPHNGALAELALYVAHRQVKGFLLLNSGHAYLNLRRVKLGVL